MTHGALTREAGEGERGTSAQSGASAGRNAVPDEHSGCNGWATGACCGQNTLSEITVFQNPTVAKLAKGSPASTSSRRTKLITTRLSLSCWPSRFSFCCDQHQTPSAASCQAHLRFWVLHIVGQHWQRHQPPQGSHHGHSSPQQEHHQLEGLGRDRVRVLPPGCQQVSCTITAGQHAAVSHT